MCVSVRDLRAYTSDVSMTCFIGIGNTAARDSVNTDRQWVWCQPAPPPPLSLSDEYFCNLIRYPPPLLQ